MSLPLLFGILSYLFIVFSLTIWLIRYHRYQFHGNDHKDHLDSREEHFENKLLSPETKDSKTTTSGKSPS